MDFDKFCGGSDKGKILTFRLLNVNINITVRKAQKWVLFLILIAQVST